MISTVRLTGARSMRSLVPSATTTAGAAAQSSSSSPQLYHSHYRARARTFSSSNSLLSTTTSQTQHAQDLKHAVQTVQAHDPAGYLPGKLLPNNTSNNNNNMQAAYFAVRSFWVETGLRFGSTAAVPPNATPAQHLQWWQQGIDRLFEKDTDSSQEVLRDEEKYRDAAADASFANHPTLRLLESLMEHQDVPWTKQHFDDLLKGRSKDLDVKQYDTLDELVRHAGQSCGSLAQLVLESGNMQATDHPVSHQAARLVGICHGLTNALRTSIPVISTTGKLIVPADLCTKYGVKSPRYLLSALGMGDEKCVRALQSAVEDISNTARRHLQEARDLRPAVLQEPNGKRAVSVLLPGLASETFLNRLEESHYQLTDRNLRQVGRLEHAVCAGRMIMAHYQQTY